MKAILFNLLLLAAISHGLCQTNPIGWTANQKLTWRDFQGPIDPLSKMAAVTESGVSYEASILQNRERYEITLDVKAYFVKENSWSHSDKQTPELLRHEQLHFDITELYARILRKAYAEHDYGGEFDQTILDKIFEKNQRQLDSVQLQYDEDSDHSRFAEGQKLWEQFITDSILTFENYADSRVRVVILRED